MTACLLSGALLTACGTNAEPDPTTISTTKPSLETTTATTEASKVEPPALPEAAKENTEEGAIAFADHFIAMQGHSATNGEVDSLKGLASDSCDFCASFLQQLSETKAVKQEIVGYLPTLENPAEYVREYMGEHVLLLEVNIPNYKLIDELGETVKQYEAQSFARGLVLEFSGSKWQVVRYGAPAE